MTGLVVVYVIFAVRGGKVFPGPPGWSSWLNMIGIVVLPVGLLMIAGELDISVGSALPAASLTVAILSGHYDLPLIVGIAGAPGLGLAIGLVAGLLVCGTTIPSLIITIGTLFAVMGLTLGLTILIAGSTDVFIVPDALTRSLLGAALGCMFQIGTLRRAGSSCCCSSFCCMSASGATGSLPLAATAKAPATPASRPAAPPSSFP